MKKKLLIGALALALTAAAVCPTAYALASAEEGAGAAEAVIAAAVLRQGSTGGEVKEVQRRLKKWGYYSGSVDGIFGSGTKKAVISFQKKNGLTADGVVGKTTYKALGMTDSYNALVSGGSSGGASSSDLYLLAKTIYAEGRGEPYTGQVAIGAVILNRVKSSSFPNTVAGVVYQPGAFTAVSDGQILHGAGGDRRGHFESREKFVFPQHGGGRRLSAGGVHGGLGRADQLRAQSDGV